jgi:putative oxidoreductase
MVHATPVPSPLGALFLSPGLLILRLALGLILVYHGWLKITGEGHEAGAAWAIKQWLQRSTPPKDLLQKMDKLAEESKDKAQRKEIERIKDRLAKDYAGATEQVPATLAFPAAQLAVAWGELIGGLALLLGFLTRVAALGIIVIQLGAIWTVTWAKGFSLGTLDNEGGFQFNLALIAMCLALALIGGGALSVDRLLFRRRKRHAAAPAPVAV